MRRTSGESAVSWMPVSYTHLKNAADLVTYAIHAWESGWGYVWGTYGSVLTDSLFAYKLEQYPDGVGS